MKIKLPIIIAFSVVLGILIGNFYAINATRGIINRQHQSESSNKLTELLQTIDAMYVDTVNVDSIVEEIIPTILEQLDPHSAYIPAKDLQTMNEELEGSFSGVGIQFNIQNDTLYIIDVISGSPAEQVGIIAGDRIITVDDSTFVGKKVSNERVMKKLRGKKGTQVKLGIKRETAKKLLQFTVIRGDIPINSVDVAYMIEPDMGFIGINKFASTTYQEFLTGVASLQKQGAKKIIVDLRGNSGGLLDAAIQMLNEFLAKDDMIVYIEGKSVPRRSSYANGTGSFQNMDLAVLIDEWSGSASEIFAGAIQDNDRGTIIGRRSFGKGLVQQQRDFSDHSALRLTIARYYTPSGRSIQKPYKPGNNLAYAEDIYKRYLHGEFYSADSIHQQDTLKYQTKGGRTVYGGGGIMPDIFVPRDTTHYTPYFYDLANHGVIFSYALKYTDKHRSTLKNYKNWKEMQAYLQTQPLYSDLEQFAIDKGVTAPKWQKEKSQTVILDQLYAYIIRNTLGDKDFYPFLNQKDITVKRAVDTLK